MRYLSIALLSLLCVAHRVEAGDLLTPRAVDPLAAATLERALDASAVVRSLVARLEASNVIVHIETRPIMPSGLGGYTRFVVSRGGYRYVRISIATALSSRRRAAILAHELQHACEIADSTATDRAQVRQVFDHTGTHRGDYFDTEAARRVEAIVRLELSAPTSGGRRGK